MNIRQRHFPWLIVGPLFALTAPSAHAQSYVPLTDPGNHWYYSHTSPWGDVDYFSLDMAFDTVINGEQYTLMAPTAEGAFRDDAGKVWFYPFIGFLPSPVDSVPLLIYDFGLQVGDTFLYPLDVTQYVTVLSRDSVLLPNGDHRMRIQHSQWPPGPLGCSSGTWIEGAGDMRWILSMAQDCFELGINFECYAYNEEWQIGNCVTQGVQPQQPVMLGEVYPNPTSDLLRLTPQPSTTRSMQVRDALGRTVAGWQRTATGIDMSRLATGCYVIEWVTQGGAARHSRIVKE